MILVVVVAVICLRAAEGLQCLSCDSVMNPLLCEHVVECASGSICSIEKFDSSGNTVYKLGCMARTRCSSRRSSHLTDIEKCRECCTYDGCNKQGCGTADLHLSSGPVCYNCDGITDPHQCKQVRTCETDERCFIQEIIRFGQRFYKTSCESLHVCEAMSGSAPFVGRKKRSFNLSKRSVLCSRCCFNDLCNGFCDFPTTTTTTTTTTIASCDHIFHSSSGSFHSPGYPHVYPNNARCTYLIHVSRNHTINLIISNFSTEKCCDHLRVYDGSSTSARQLAVLDGPVGSKYILSTGNTMFLYFTTDGSVLSTGFQASYTSNTRVNCGISHALSGVFTSPQYPSNYENNIHCGYLIDVPKNYTITLSVKEIITDSCCDHLMIYDGPTTNERELASLSGTHRNLTYKSTGHTMLLLFNTDGSHAQKGFMVEYKTNDICGRHVFTSSDGTVKSPDYPSHYQNDIECSYRIIVNSNRVVELNFTHIDTETTDQIRVYDGSTASNYLTKSLNGKHNETITIISHSNNVLITFKTDGSITRPGFIAKYRAIYTGCGGNFTSGSGSLSSPHYPNNYENFADCKFLIHVQSGRRVTLNIPRLITEVNYDFVRIYDGSTNSTSLLAFLNGNHTNLSYTSTSNYMFVRFTSDVSNTFSGFSATYSSHT